MRSTSHRGALWLGIRQDRGASVRALIRLSNAAVDLLSSDHRYEPALSIGPHA